MKPKLSIAVVGCGYWGPNLIRNFNSLAECKVSHVVDTDSKRLDYIQSLFPSVKTAKSCDDVICETDVDCVAIATPVHLHHDLAKKSLEAKKHTFIEKPMAASSQQCMDLNDIAAKNEMTLMVGHTFIYTPAVRKIKEIIDNGDLGEIYYISSQRLNLGLFQKDINVAWDLAPHDISIIQHIYKQTPVAVNCQGKANLTQKIEDITNMTIFFANGGFATIQNSWLDPNKIRKMTFVGSKRMLVYDDTEPLEKIKIYDKRVETPPYYDTFGEFQYSYHYGDIYVPYLKQTEPLKFECQQFIDCIRTGAEPESSGKEGLMVVQILEAASRSLQNGGAKVSIDSIG